MFYNKGVAFMIIVKGQVSAKKGDKQDFSFLIQQDIPFPRIKGYGSGLDWENGYGIFKERGNPATGLKEEYTAVLLRSDLEGEPKGESRAEHAGFEENPGSITYRGNDLGEMQLDFSIHSKIGIYCNKIQLRSYKSATESEKNFIKEQIIPHIIEAIQENKQELYEEAVNRIKGTMEQNLREHREELIRLEKEKNEIIDSLYSKIDNSTGITPG